MIVDVLILLVMLGPAGLLLPTPRLHRPRPSRARGRHRAPVPAAGMTL